MKETDMSEVTRALFGEDFDTLPEQFSVEEGNSADVARLQWRIKKYEEQKAEFTAQKDDAIDFYVKKMAGLDTQVRYTKDLISQWMTYHKKDKLITYNGTVFYMNKKRITLPDDTVLLEFIRAQDVTVQNELLTTSVKPNKTTVKQYIESTGRKPAGYVEEEERILCLRGK
jgi:hypothetical protein